MLPNADRAVVDLDTRRRHALSTGHTRGRHKARVFASALGLRASDAEWLRDRILEAVRDAPAIETNASVYGRYYRVSLDLRTDRGAATVQTRWIVSHRRDVPPTHHLLRPIVTLPLRLLDTVALLCDLPEHGLVRGQVEALDEGVWLAEFSDDDGCTYPMSDVRDAEVMALRFAPAQAA